MRLKTSATSGQGQISHCKIPHYVAFVNDDPMTAGEKIQKYKFVIVFIYRDQSISGKMLSWTLLHLW